MERRRTFVALFLSLAVSRIGAQQVPDVAPYLMADRAAEVTLARSAAPKNVSDSATVLVLTPKGFVQALAGKNGFTCAVFRSFSGVVGDPAFWNPRVRAPQCFNAPAARTVLPVMVKRVEWLLSGVSPSELEARTNRAYASHELSPPETGAMAYMLSHDQYLGDSDPHWMPHVMFFYDKSLVPATWGAGDQTAPVIDAGDPHGPVLTLFVPVRRWSDGTPSFPLAGH
jgi:hypothetical protein